jgi:hypothetical protein
MVVTGLLRFSFKMIICLSEIALDNILLWMKRKLWLPDYYKGKTHIHVPYVSKNDKYWRQFPEAIGNIYPDLRHTKYEDNFQKQLEIYIPT